MFRQEALPIWTRQAAKRFSWSRPAVRLLHPSQHQGGAAGKVTPVFFAVERPRYQPYGVGSLTADESPPAGWHRGGRWLLLALLCFVLAVVLGFAMGHAQTEQDKLQSAVPEAALEPPAPSPTS